MVLISHCVVSLIRSTLDRWQTGQPSSNSTNVPSNVATTADLENLKKELTNVMRTEIATAKQEILDGLC